MTPTLGGPAPGEQFDVVALGPAAVDDLIWVDTYPPADTKARVVRRARRIGGVSAVALVAASRLGARTAYAGILDSTAGPSRFVLDTLSAAGVDTSHVCDYPGATPALSVVVVDDQNKTRTIFYDPSGLVGPDDDWLPKALLQSTCLLLVDNFRMDLTIRAARVARDAGAAILADLENPAAPRVDELLTLVDHLVVPEDFALAVTGQTNPRRAALKLHSPDRDVVVTCGVDGAWYVRSTPPTDAVHQLAFPVDAVDTNGCGDVFHGAYAAAFARHFELGERVRFASAAAALAATTPSGDQASPDTAEVDRFLRERSENG